jgi:hypothetical protein
MVFMCGIRAGEGFPKRMTWEMQLFISQIHARFGRKRSMTCRLALEVPDIAEKQAGVIDEQLIYITARA